MQQSTALEVGKAIYTSIKKSEVEFFRVNIAFVSQTDVEISMAIFPVIGFTN